MAWALAVRGTMPWHTVCDLHARVQPFHETEERTHDGR